MGPGPSYISDVYFCILAMYHARSIVLYCKYLRRGAIFLSNHKSFTFYVYTGLNYLIQLAK